MSLRETIEIVGAGIVVVIVAALGFALSNISRRTDSDVIALRHQLALTAASRDSARLREKQVRDSATRIDGQRDSAWLDYVTDLSRSNAKMLERNARGAASRARQEIAFKSGIVLPETDTTPGRDQCEVVLSCADEVARQASDSLLRARVDSVVGWQHVAGVSCSARVEQARVTCESLCVDHLSKSSGRSSSRGFLSLIFAGIAGVALGMVAGW